MKAVEIKKGIYWVGAIDYNLRSFHGYTTPRGTTYNAYLVIDEKTTLIDTVKAPFKDELLKRVSSVVNPKEIDYLIANHVEMDHSGSASAVVEQAGDIEVICTAKGEDFLHAHYPGSTEWNIQTVGSEDTLNIGKRNLSFIPAPMLHWPDTMFTYSASDRVLFSNDGFGQHIATPRRFCDEAGDWNVFGEAQKYYANILMPYSRMAAKKLDELKGVPVDVVCPSHGVIFREKGDINRIVSLYKSWAAGESKEKAVIVYDTMYNSTEKMARAIDDGLRSMGVDTRIFNLRVSDLSDIMSEVLDAAAVIVGSSTLNNGPMPSIGGFLTYLKGLRPRGKIGFAFGSYGWGGGAVKAINQELEATGFELPVEGFQTRFVPGRDALSQSFKRGVQLANQIKRR
ncbi:MAG TPA: FprA family A-type flavoprotein [Euryarchaeota archaeon]|nr:FprA family A-type flavoprotein [Euryarchaeota archaeon]